MWLRTRTAHPLYMYSYTVVGNSLSFKNLNIDVDNTFAAIGSELVGVFQNDYFSFKKTTETMDLSYLYVFLEFRSF